MTPPPRIPITSRQQMVRLLEAVRANQLDVMEAVVRIEQWGEDWAARNLADYKQRQAAKPAQATTMDGRRGDIPLDRSAGPNLS